MIFPKSTPDDNFVIEPTELCQRGDCGHAFYQHANGYTDAREYDGEFFCLAPQCDCRAFVRYLED